MIHDPHAIALRVCNLRARYDGPEVLHGVDLEVVEGQVSVLLGPNGAGKTTMLRAIAGLLPRAEGEVWVSGRSLGKSPAHKRSAAGLGFVPEGRGVFSGLTVRENLILNLGRKVDLSGVFNLFPILAERIEQPAGGLSGGQQQMLGIARVVLRDPALIVIDEPSLGLAPTLVARVFDALRTLSEQGRTVLIAEQNAVAALELAHTGYVLDRGRIVLSGPAEELRQDQRVVDAYLGN